MLITKTSETSWSIYAQESRSTIHSKNKCDSIFNKAQRAAKLFQQIKVFKSQVSTTQAMASIKQQKDGQSKSSNGDNYLHTHILVRRRLASK